MRGPNSKTTGIARRLRGNQTDAETVLWNRIRNRQIDGHKFVRQLPIETTSAILFAASGCSSLKWMAGSTMNRRRMR